MVQKKDELYSKIFEVKFLLSFQILQGKKLTILTSQAKLLGIGLRLSPAREIGILLVCTNYNILNRLV